MSAPHNPFKAALQAGKPQLGCWLGLADSYISEISAHAGFDWLLIDGEHAPNDLRSILPQLKTIEAGPSHPVVRLPAGETWMIKQILDIGTQTIMVPMVHSAEDAVRLVKAVRYPPQGIRGVGAALGRATRFNMIENYEATANEEICLLVQVESQAGISALDEILGVDGVDGVFIGPADLAADMGHLGNSMHPDVIAVITDALSRIAAAGKAAGIITLDREFQKTCLDLGTTFLATDVDVFLFGSAMRQAAARAKRLADG